MGEELEIQKNRAQHCHAGKSSNPLFPIFCRKQVHGGKQRKKRKKIPLVDGKADHAAYGKDGEADADCAHMKKNRCGNQSNQKQV